MAHSFGEVQMPKFLPAGRQANVKSDPKLKCQNSFVFELWHSFGI
jgi:hypothetical protein